MDGITVIVNGRPRDCSGTSPHTRLLDWLRAEGLTGAKEGCAEGECGACAVLVARPDGPGSSRWTSVNACLPPALAFDGQEIITAEGLGRCPWRPPPGKPSIPSSRKWQTGADPNADTALRASSAHGGRVLPP